MSMCGCEGRVPPTCFTVIPFFIAGPTSNSAETNWLDELASISITPPLSEPEPLIVSGRAKRFL